MNRLNACVYLESHFPADAADALAGHCSVDNGVCYRPAASGSWSRCTRRDGWNNCSERLKNPHYFDSYHRRTPPRLNRVFIPGAGAARGHAMQYDDLWFAISIAWVLVLLGATILAIF